MPLSGLMGRLLIVPKPKTRKQRFYSLFLRVGKRWQQLTEMGLTKPIADRYFARFVEAKEYFGYKGKLEIRPCR